MLKTPTSQFEHVTPEQLRDITDMVNHFPCLFSAVPPQTTIHEHDVDVNKAKPIKQHPYCVNHLK